MSQIEHVLRANGYDVEYVTCEKYLGAGQTTLCIARKGGVTHYAFRIEPPDQPEHHKRIHDIQESTSRMAKIIGPIGDIILSVQAAGQNLWSMNIFAEVSLVEAQLIEFAQWTRQNQLIHGDLRPWNVFYDLTLGVQVIDWRALSAFTDDLPRRIDLVEGHYTTVHAELVEQGRLTEIDLRDALTIGRLLRGEIGVAEAWPQVPSRRPNWCKP